MKKFITHLLRVFCFCIVSSLSAQDLEWVIQMGGTGATAAGNKIVTDRFGNVLTMGTYSGTVDFDPGPNSYTLNSGAGTTFLSKLDSSGNFLWAKQLVNGADLTTDKYGNVFILGTYTGTVDVDPGPATYTISSIPMYRTSFILKLNPAGDFTFAKAFITTGTFGSCLGRSILIDSQQNIYTLGSYWGGPFDFDPGVGTFTLNTTYVQVPSGGTFTEGVFLSKLDSNGIFVFVKKVGSSYNSISLTATINKNDELIFVYNSLAYNGWQSSYCFIRKYNTTGNEVWGKGFANFRVGPVSVDQTNNINIVGAVFYGTIDINPGPGIFSAGPGSSTIEPTFILQLNNSGSFNWAYTIQVANGSNIAVTKNITDASGAHYIAGTFSGVIDFDPSAQVTATLNSANGNGFIAKSNVYGTFEWVKQIGKNFKSSVNSITLDDYGNFYTTGFFTGTPNFDPGPGAFSLMAYGARDAFVHKLSGEVITGISEQGLTNEARFFPNPAHSVLYVQVKDPLDKAACRIMDMNGKLVQEERNISGTSFSMDVAVQPNGVYMVELSDAKTKVHLKLIKD